MSYLKCEIFSLLSNRYELQTKCACPGIKYRLRYLGYRVLQQCSIRFPFLDTFQALCRQSESVTRWQRLVCLHAATPKSLHVFRVCTDPRGCVVLRRGSAATPLLRLRVRIPPGEWMYVLCVVRYATPHRANHSPRGVLQGMVCRVRQTQIMRRPWPTRVCHTRGGGGEIGYNIILRPEIVFGTKSILQSRMFKFVWNLRLFTAPLRI